MLPELLFRKIQTACSLLLQQILLRHRIVLQNTVSILDLILQAVVERRTIGTSSFLPHGYVASRNTRIVLLHSFSFSLTQWFSTFFVPGPIVAMHYNPTAPI